MSSGPSARWPGSAAGRWAATMAAFALFRPGRGNVLRAALVESRAAAADVASRGHATGQFADFLARRGASFYREVFVAAGGRRIGTRGAGRALGPRLGRRGDATSTFAPLRALRWKRPGGDGGRGRVAWPRSGPRRPPAAGRGSSRASARGRRSGRRDRRRGRRPWADAGPDAPRATERLHALALALLDRHGVLTREAVMAEGDRRRVCRRLPGSPGTRGGGPDSARLLRRRAGRGPVRPRGAIDRLRAARDPERRAAARRPARGGRPGPAVRRRARLAASRRRRPSPVPAGRRRVRRPCRRGGRPLRGARAARASRPSRPPTTRSARRWRSARSAASSATVACVSSSSPASTARRSGRAPVAGAPRRGRFRAGLPGHGPAAAPIGALKTGSTSGGRGCTGGAGRRRNSGCSFASEGARSPTGRSAPSPGRGEEDAKDDPRGCDRRVHARVAGATGRGRPPMQTVSGTGRGWSRSPGRRRPAAAITVTNNTDKVDADTSSVEALQSNPGPDGISLREAIEATNNDPGSYAIAFSPTLSGTTITLGQYLPPLTGGGVSIEGDIDGDGTPDVTLVTTLQEEWSRAIQIASSGNRLHGLTLQGLRRRRVDRPVHGRPRGCAADPPDAGRQRDQRSRDPRDPYGRRHVPLAREPRLWPANAGPVPDLHHLREHDHHRQHDRDDPGARRRDQHADLEQRRPHRGRHGDRQHDPDRWRRRHRTGAGRERRRRRDAGPDLRGR